MGRISQYFKVKVHEIKRPTTVFYKIFVFAIVVATLCLAFLWPSQISALWFQLWMLILQFLRTPIHFQLWWFALVALAIAWLGWLFMPVIEVPNVKLRLFYTRTWSDGSIRYFKILQGYYLSIGEDKVAKNFFRFTAFHPMRCTFQDNMLICQTDEMEITREMMWKKTAQMVIDENKRLRAELSRKEKSLTLDDIVKIEKARHGGEKE